MSTAGSVLDYFTPSVQSTLDANNLDLGSGGVLLLPDQSGAHPHEMVSAGKNGTIYLVDRDNMGHYNPSQDRHGSVLVNIFPNNLGQEGGNFGSPVYFNGVGLFRSGSGRGPGVFVDQRVVVNGADVPLLRGLRLAWRHNGHLRQRHHQRNPLDSAKYRLVVPGCSARVQRNQPE